MENLIFWCVIAALSFMVLEKISPARQLPESKSWWSRVLMINFIQVAIVVAAGKTWDPFFQSHHMFSIFKNLGDFVGGLLGYLSITFIFYWWHKLRHDSNFLWSWFHQLHHSATRIETITSFYKHPFEILVNSLIMGCCSYMLLGLTPTQAGWATFLSAVGEYIYHANIRTPYWMGFFFQRPEMHRVHHQVDVHYYNFSDLPLWDLLFGTFRNPKEDITECGFGIEKETQFVALLKGKVISNEIL